MSECRPIVAVRGDMMREPVFEASEARSMPFAKVYDPAGYDRLDDLVDIAEKGGATTARLFLWLFRHAGHLGAVAVTVELLAELLKVSERTVYRCTCALVDRGAITVAKLGNSNVYCLNDSEVWKTYEDHKRYSSFGAKVIVGHKENPGMRVRVQHYLPDPELPLEGGAS